MILSSDSTLPLPSPNFFNCSTSRLRSFEEMGHASATWLTCGRVKKIEVYNNEGGITGYAGGVRTIIIPAGYVGGAWWGGAFIALSGHRIGATVAASVIAAALLIALVYVLFTISCRTLTRASHLSSPLVCLLHIYLRAHLIRHNPNRTVVYISLGFTTITLVAIVIDWFWFDPFLQYITLFYGTFLGYYAVRDIWDDT